MDQDYINSALPRIKYTRSSLQIRWGTRNWKSLYSIIYWAVIKKQKKCFRSKGNSHRFSVSSFSLPCFQIRDQVTSSVKIHSPLKNYNYFRSLLQTFLTQSSHDISVLCSLIRASIMLGEKRKPFSRSQFTVVGLNPLSPSIHIQILQTDLYTFR